MKREDLTAMGLTDEQIEKVIAENSKDIQTANAKATKNNVELERLQGIEKEFNAMKDQNLSEQEKAAKQLEEANKRIAELEKAQTLATQRTSAADKFKITAEQAAQVVKDDGSFDFEVLGKIISDKETAAAQAKEQEIANGSTNPGGGSAGGSENKKTADVENAEKITFGNEPASEEARNHYVL